MIADNLSRNIWDAIADQFRRSGAPREIVFGKVHKRDTDKKVIWLEEYGNLAIPLVSFDTGFSYYDTDELGHLQRRSDPSDTNSAYQTHLIVPRLGEIAVILDPGGQRRFPLCVGVIQSNGYWQGEA